MAHLRRLILALLVVAAAQAPCQEVAGRRVDIAFDMAGLRASTLDITAGLDIARFLGLGVLWGMGFQDAGILDLGAGVWCTATLLSEGQMGLPVTLVIDGAFRKVRSLGDSLATQSLVRSGTAASLGVEVSRTWAISKQLGFLTAIRGSYRFSTMTTEAMAGSGSTFLTLIVPAAQVLIVARLGLTLAVAERLHLQFGLEAGLDGSFAFHYGPTVSLISR
jgi:hypothetical protein